MAEHPPVTVTPQQYEQLQPFFAYELTPALNATMMAFSAYLLEVALHLVVLEPTDERALALRTLRENSAWTQQALILSKGIAHPPPWLHVEEPSS